MSIGKKPTVFVSSTCYDLKQIRTDLKSFFEEQLGYDVLLSEYASFPIDPNIGTANNCLRAVDERADIFVLVVGCRYGCVTETGHSITNMEYLRAKEKGIPIYAFVDKRILNILPLWRDNPDVNFQSTVDTPKLFEFVDTFRANDRIWSFDFETAQDIISKLRAQLGYLFYDSLKLKHGHKTSVKEHNDVMGKKNVLMLPRREIHNRYSIDNRLHISDGLYKQIRHIRIMNFASNLIINPEIGEIGHIPPKDIQLSDAIEKIMRETKASVELILTKPSKYNLKDLETKIANHRAGSGKGALYSALATLYKNLATDTIYAQNSVLTPVLFQSYVMKTSMPFGIFNVEFLGEAKRLSHVKVDLYSAALDNEDARRSFVIWQDDDQENYQFFIKNFDNVKNNPLLCEKATLEMLKVWAEEWENIKPGGKK